MGQRIIGLTGGIATGKSTVSHYLATQHGIPVLDADVFARQAVEPGSAILQAIAERYGAAILHPDGQLNRGQLGRIVFSQPEEKRWLEAQIHPFVRQRFQDEMTRLAAAPVVVQAIPLLFEANLTAQVTEIWVVTCPQAVQIHRLMTRDGLSLTDAEARIHSQWPLADKVRRADVVLENHTTRHDLYRQVEAALAAG